MAIEKSKAEQYRDERKARIAEAAKKNAKDMQKKNATKKLAKRIISIVLVAAIALGAVALALNYYGVWDRTINVGLAGDDKFTMAEYEYYYWSAYNDLLNKVSQGQMSGYDSSKSPDEQTSMTQDAQGNPITWVEYLRDKALTSIMAQTAFVKEAEALGIATLTEDEQKQIDDLIASWREQAESEQYKMTLNAYLRTNFGKYMNEKMLRKIVEREIICENYQEHVYNKIKDSYDPADIKAKYEKDKLAYDLVDFRMYEFAKTKLTAEKGESNDALKKRQEEADAKTKKDAEAFLAAAKDEASFIAKAKELNKDTKDYDVDTQTKLRSMLKSDVNGTSKDMAEWLFAEGTKVGDVKMFEVKDANAYYVVLLTAKPRQVETVSVRHILFSTSDMTTGAALSEAEIAQKKKDAEAALEKWKSGEKTEDSFAALATELTEDTGSQSTGGLYENVLPGRMVKEFDQWIFDKARKEGDVAIVETQYGFHVMYFVKNDGMYYESKIKNTLVATDIEVELSKVVESGKYETSFGPKRIEYAEDKMNKHIADLIAKQSAQQSYSYM